MLQIRFRAATVLGPGSAWSMAGVLTLGNQGFGRITINGGGLVQSGGGVLGTSGEGLGASMGLEQNGRARVICLSVNSATLS